ncbi:phosphonate C-P lyase system protein PhnG [Deinococcus koreensis]|uniref:Phosphonate C-P lyase system protein PhnG n=1 Tax=Deinococcus koreensis TaxID=2054903 RepID=A0A2K3UY25_9DEIO|nr:phosphonate C-P lyase system protein PhnG [Deinococcus koreensis]PNY81440.1 phosphonate C-P lyase system protein PhnG [Deinococcus koreensis]
MSHAPISHESPPWTQGTWLSVLAAAPAAPVKALADALLPELHAHGALEVVHNRAGLVMLPYRDTVRGTPFHLGEVLVAEGHVRQGQLTGYGACLGGDLEQALAVALLDLAAQRGDFDDRLRPFVLAQAGAQAAETHTLLRQVEATRVQMETF